MNRFQILGNFIAKSREGLETRLFPFQLLQDVCFGVFPLIGAVFYAVESLGDSRLKALEGLANGLLAVKIFLPLAAMTAMLHFMVNEVIHPSRADCVAIQI